jgi:hypothetical protein
MSLAMAGPAAAAWAIRASVDHDLSINSFNTSSKLQRQLGDA